MDADEIKSQAEAASGGDAGALAKLCELYYPKILTFMHYRVHPDCAEDLTSIVFCRVVNKITFLSGSFNGWIYKIARNVVIDHYRYNGRRSYVEFEDGITKVIGDANYGTVSLFNMNLDLKEILEALDDSQRELLVLRFIQGYTSDEVAEVMAMKSGAVRTMQTRLLAKLRENYRKEA